MSPNHATLADAITTELGLDTPPVALAFVDAPPPGVAELSDEVPSACTLWRRAEAGVFYAPAARHFNCAVGAMVLGFDLPESVQQKLGASVEMMSGCGYLDPAEAASIPVVAGAKKGVLYGPLRDFPVDPDLVLMWLTPRQAMLYAEAVGSTHWNSAAPATVLGRPACAVLPAAQRAAGSAMSLGCTGMRTFTGIADDRMLVALTGDGADSLVSSLRATGQANATMGSYYREQRAQFA
jgi:uncharacterized protein (DUF169 family)